jgi:hypothetical protein
MNAMPNVKPDPSFIEVLDGLIARYKGDVRKIVFQGLMSRTLHDAQLRYDALEYAVEARIREQNDEAAGQEKGAPMGHLFPARSSSPNDGGDGPWLAASNGHKPTAYPPSPNADGVGHEASADNGPRTHAHPSATERDDEAVSDAPANPGQALPASSSLHVRERGGPLTSAGNGRQPAASPPRGPSLRQGPKPGARFKIKPNQPKSRREQVAALKAVIGNGLWETTTIEGKQWVHHRRREMPRLTTAHGMIAKASADFFASTTADDNEKTPFEMLGPKGCEKLLKDAQKEACGLMAPWAA